MPNVLTNIHNMPTAYFELLLGEYQPGNFMDLGDDVFTNFKTTQAVSTVNMENCDNTSTDSNDEVAEDLVENCSLFTNIIQFLKMNEKQRKRSGSRAKIETFLILPVILSGSKPMPYREDTSLSRGKYGGFDH